MEEQKSTIVIIAQSVLDGTIGIEQVWQTYGNLIRSTKEVHGHEEAMALVGLYLRQGQHLAEEGYLKDAMPYMDDALNTLELVKEQMSRREYEDAFEAIVSRRAQVTMHLDRYIESLKDVRLLRQMFPRKDEYRMAYISGISNIIAKYTNPVYIALAVLFLVKMLEVYLFDTHVIPGWLVDVGWGLWIVMLIVQFGLPWILKKTMK